MGLALSGDLLLDELNTIDDPNKQFRMIRGLVDTIQKKNSFLGFWNAASNLPVLTASEEGSFYNVVVGADTSVVGRCLSGDWIIYMNGNWSVIHIALQESTSNILLIEPPNNIVVKKSSSSQDGYLSSTDWTTFNAKQAAIENAPTTLKFSDSISSQDSTTILSARAIQSLSSSQPIPDSLWNPITNKPELRDGAGIVGYRYLVSHDGVNDLGLGSRAFTAKSIISYNLTSQRWE